MPTVPSRKRRDRVDPNVVIRVILHVLRHVTDSRFATASNLKLKNRIVTLLIGKKGILADLIRSANQKTVSSALHIGLHATEDYPPKVQEAVERIAMERFPQLFETKEPDFWEDESVIYTSKEGLEAFREEFLELRDVKIPANSKAIGAAASQGDLSENAEWDAALEDQRNLTNQANEMEERLKRAKDLREVEIPDGVVAPGTRVSVEDLDDGKTEASASSGRGMRASATTSSATRRRSPERCSASPAAKRARSNSRPGSVACASCRSRSSSERGSERVVQRSRA